MLRNWMRIVIMFFDALLVPLAWFSVFWLKYNFTTIPHSIFLIAVKELLIVLSIQVVVNAYFGLHRGMWRFFSTPDLIRILQAVGVGSVISAVLMFVFLRMEIVSRAILPLYGLLYVALLGGVRVTYRWIHEQEGRVSQGKRVLIIGAGLAGVQLVRELAHKNNKDFCPVGLIDDDPRKRYKDIHGIPVLGDTKDIPSVVDEYKIQLVLIAIPSLKAVQMRRILDICRTLQIEIRTLPSVYDLASGRVSISHIREVSLEDLLGRNPVTLEWSNIVDTISDKTILITGAGGSIGSELCRQVIKCHPKMLLLLDHCEYNLYSIDKELQETCPHITIKKFLVDTVDLISLKYIFNQYQPNVILHAAAYKHVPLLEKQIRSAVRNNILGTWVLAKAAIEYKVDKFVLISTDKAVNPTNVMGATKRAAEKVCLHFNELGVVPFVTVRFGNVLGSTGSVIPLFNEQIKRGGPVTVTHPDISRFFMTIPEASQLILQSSYMGKGGEIFVLDMGEPIKIRFLAEQLIQLSGYEVGKDIDIVYTGLRPGEKLHEELFYETENLVGTGHSKILRANVPSSIDLEFDKVLDQFWENCQTNNENELVKLLLLFVPEYKPFVPLLEEAKEEVSSGLDIVVPLPDFR